MMWLKIKCVISQHIFEIDVFSISWFNNWIPQGHISDVNIGSKPLSKPVLTQFYNAIWYH